MLTDEQYDVIHNVAVEMFSNVNWEYIPTSAIEHVNWLSQKCGGCSEVCIAGFEQWLAGDMLGIDPKTIDDANWWKELCEKRSC